MTQTHVAGAGLAGLALGAAGAALALWALGTPWNSERVVEVEKVVERVIEMPAPEPKPKRPGVDLIVMQKNKPLGLDSDFGEYFVTETRKIPGVERVSEGVVSNATAKDNEGIQFLVWGWKPDNFGYDDIELTEGRKLVAEDTRKVMLGKTLAENLKRKTGDKLTFSADPETPYEVVGVFKSRVVFEQGGAIVPFKDGQSLTGKLVTGFSVRVKNPAADTAAVKQKIEALRDPKDPTVRLDAQAPDRP